jgi:hypothetical protein
MGGILGCTKKVLRISRRGQVFEGVYTPENGVPETAVRNLYGALTKLYAAALDLLAEAKPLCSKGPEQPGGLCLLLAALSSCFESQLIGIWKRTSLV